jgi:mRNA-degrading endonuclease RelE of RelBE toxin-antitoxin system
VRRIDGDIALHILIALDRFVRTREGDVKALQGRDELRLRVGDNRLRFHDLGHTLYVTAVKHRREAYR